LWGKYFGQPLQVQDPANQPRFLSDLQQPTPSEASQPMKLLALSKEFLDLLPTSLRQSIRFATPSHAHPLVEPTAATGVGRDVRLYPVISVN